MGWDENGDMVTFRRVTLLSGNSPQAMLEGSLGALLGGLTGGEGGGQHQVRMMITPADMDSLISEFLGTVPVGVADIESVTDRLTVQECPPDSTCTICCEPLRSLSSNARRIKRCGHTYCAPCIERWLSTNKKCPVCRCFVDELSENP